MIYKGREIAHQNLGEQIMSGVVAALIDVAKVERPPFREGKRVGLVLAPKQAMAEKGAEKLKAAAAPASPTGPAGPGVPAQPKPAAPAIPVAAQPKA